MPRLLRYEADPSKRRNLTGWFRGRHTSGSVGASVTFDRNTWIPAVMLNGWQNWGNAFAPVSFYKDQFGEVHLRGLARGGASTANTTSNTIFQLPEGFRPAHQLVFPTLSGDGVVGRINIFSNGVVTTGVAHNTVVFMTFEHVSFRTDQ